jgi:hypothetical protein
VGQEQPVIRKSGEEGDVCPTPRGRRELAA